MKLSSQEDEWKFYQPQIPHPGYQIICDNLNWHQKKRHKTSANQNNQYNYVQAYSVLDRVNLEALENSSPIRADIRRLPRDTWWLHK